MAWASKLPSGKYRATYRDSNGKLRSAGTFPHKRAATNAAAAAEQAARALGWRDPDAAGRTWGDWATEWWGTRHIEPASMASETYLLDAHLRPKWEDVALIDITRQEGRRWIAELTQTESKIGAAEQKRRAALLAKDPGAKIEKKFLSAASVQRIVGILSASLTAAVDAEIIPANPVFRLKLPRRPQGAERFLTREEFRALTAEMDNPYDAAAIALMAGCGLRWGEAQGLHRHRIDRERGWIRVVEVWDSKAKRIKPYPKGKQIREVPLPGWVAEALDGMDTAAAKSCGHVHAEGRCRSNLVLHEVGEMVDLNNWRKRVWGPALARAGIDHATPHDLRHTYASWLIQAGVSIEEVARLLGHSSPSMTKRYAHLAATPQASVLGALGDPFREANVKQREAEPHPIGLKHA